MKKRLQYLVGTLLLAPFLVATPAFAAQNNSANSSVSNSNLSNSTSVNDNSSKTELETELEKQVETETKKDTEVNRLKARIALYKIKLTAAEVAKLKLKCVAAQSKISALDTRVNNGVTIRGKVYAELLDHLDKLITKLKAANVDTAKLEAERAELKAKVSTFTGDLAKYKITLDDAKGLGCVADPTGFKASLEAARAAQLVVTEDAVAIRSYVNGAIKPTLKTIKQGLAKTNSNSITNSTTDAIGGSR